MTAFAQLAAELYSQGKTIWDQLETIYRQHGFYINAQRSIKLDPNSPPIGDKLRATPPTEIAGRKVLMTDDLKSLTRYIADGTTQAIQLPASDVLTYHLEGGARVIVRPSGTEPKLKCYYEVVGAFEAEEDFASAEKKADEQMAMLIAEHQHSL